MVDDFRGEAVLRSKGRLFEDFHVGQTFTHHWGRTVTESDTLTFSTLFLHFNPLYLNRDYARAMGHPDIVVNPHLLFNIVLGLSVEDCSEIGGPFLGVYELMFDRPVYPGTTLVAKSETVETKVTSDGSRGIVTWRTEGFDGEGGRVLGFRRANLVGLRNPQGAA